MSRIYRARFKIAHHFHKKRELSDCRKINLGVFVDIELLNNNSKWKILNLALQTIKLASKHFENNFDVSFTALKFFIWKLPSEVSVFDSDLILNNLNALTRRNSHNFDILLGITERRLFSLNNRARAHGTALQYGRTAIIRLNEFATNCLLHELGHIFGADHTSCYSIMNCNSIDAIDFDEFNKKIILANRNRRF